MHPDTETVARVRTPARAARRPLPPWLTLVAPPFAGALGVLLLWWLVTRLGHVREFLLPGPGAVVEAFWTLHGYLLSQTLTTLLEVVEGFALSVVVGVAIGVGIAAWRAIERTIYPLLLGINAVPKLAVAPLLVVWLGFGQVSKVVMVFLVCFFPIVISTATGLLSTPPELVELARSLSAGGVRTFVKIRFPAALREIFVGLKVAISLAVIGAVIGEFAGADVGLGFVIQQAGANANTALAFAAMTLLGILSIVLFYLLVGVERLLAPWTRRT
ncbi:ABC transporter permease [Actinocatenispora rupis]|uniref:ABC transporter permease n=1 Tax=Actinocatenispora rupis TaxID=519421 RepID=A0A8J3IY02_9ACTN|nr:ABC transporter permease [Actinocatenispora rupis]GID10733.1 ABC transporter permease [Actinocatenispora rupis]